ncbi:MAG TPA: PLD nuclease N-terminal domain-containing protein [Candidatus Limnocylindrales bacterium]|nr:PLD nuclease N-terminal domain-containing protein [Candidatus Limnocylindrales bacterium]
MQNPFELLRMLWPLLALQLLLMIWALVDLSRRKQVKKLPKLGWAAIIAFINLFGPIIYFLYGRGDE